MRKQHHFRPGESGTRVWDVDRLVELARDLPVRRVPLAGIRELEEVYWFDGLEHLPTCRAVLEHMRLIQEADLSYPIVLSSDGRVMDGMHRVAKAVLEGRASIDAVQFERDPEPDRIDPPRSRAPEDG